MGQAEVAAILCKEGPAKDRGQNCGPSAKDHNMGDREKKMSL